MEPTDGPLFSLKIWRKFGRDQTKHTAVHGFLDKQIKQNSSNLSTKDTWTCFTMLGGFQVSGSLSDWGVQCGIWAVNRTGLLRSLVFLNRRNVCMARTVGDAA